MRRAGHRFHLQLVLPSAVTPTLNVRLFSSRVPRTVEDESSPVRSLDDDNDVESMAEALLHSSGDADNDDITRPRRVSNAFVPPLILRHMNSGEAKRSRARDLDDGDEDADRDEKDVVGEGEEVGEASADSAASVIRHPHPGESGVLHSQQTSASLEAYLQAYPAEGPSHSLLYDTPLSELLEKVTTYCRSSDNPRLVNADDEVALFPALVRRLPECTSSQLLDVAEMSMARSTLVRHGLLLRDLIRDRIGMHAGHLTPSEVLRSIVVMGIVVAGRRKRDLEFFQVLGRLFAVHINQYKDPGDLVRVMTAFSRAKIVPPPAFLDLIGRRLPVLSKAHPLAPLPAYRLLTNLFKMGHDQLPSFRFLADRICQHTEVQLRNERAALRTAAYLSLQPAQRKTDSSATPQAHEHPQRAADIDRVSGSSVAPTAVTATVMVNPVIATRRRFVSLSGLRPSQFTKLLLVLARCGAPHQQYLRPFVDALLAPSVPQLSPPVFSRLVRLIRVFRSPDTTLISTVLEHVVTLGPHKALAVDLIELIRILAAPDVPPIPSTPLFIALCAEAFRTSQSLRPADMCAVSFELMRIQEKVDVPLESVESLVGVLDEFARRMLRLLDLRVLSLQHAELLTEACRRMHHPDAGGVLEQLRQARLAVNEADGSDEAYYATMDIDVRETFHMILVVNHSNTFGAFRPIPGALQADLRHGLTMVSATCILQAAHLFEQAFPGTMMQALERILSRSFLAKLRAEGEEVVVQQPPSSGIDADSEGERVVGRSSLTTTMVLLRPNEPLRFSRASLHDFVRLLLTTPLTGVRSNVPLWQLLEAKALKLGVAEMVDVCRQQRLQQTKKQQGT